MRFDPDKYHRRSVRLEGYDYSHPGAYFVTICTHGQECILGDVIDDCMQLSLCGEIAWQTWRGLPQRSQRIGLDHFVIMPNHVHGIIVITPPDVGAMHVGAVHVGAIHAQSRRQARNCPYKGEHNAGACYCQRWSAISR